jgi:hypothetical protein
VKMKRLLNEHEKLKHNRDSIVTKSTPLPLPFVDQRRQQHVKRKIDSSDFDNDNEHDGDNSNNPQWGTLPYILFSMTCLGLFYGIEKNENN